jgi:hypothetical protein
LDQEDWFLVVGAVILGQFALLAVESLRAQLDRWQRTMDRKKDFDRENLLTLQEHIVEHRERTHTVIIYAMEHWTDSNGKIWNHLPLAPEVHALMGESTRSEFKVRVFVTRVKDEDMRRIVSEILEVKVTMTRSPSVEEMATQHARFTQLTIQAVDRAGELLRSA